MHSTEKRFPKLEQKVFLAVQDSSITDIVGPLVGAN